MSDVTSEAPTRRSRFLGGVALFVSAWLLAFAADGVLSTLDDLSMGLGAFHGLTLLREIVAAIVLAFAVFVALILVFVPQVPKRIFVLPAVYAFWANLWGWPLAATAGQPLSSLPLDFIQIALAALALYQVRKLSGRFLLRATDLPVKTHLVRRTFIALGVVFLGLLVAMPIVGAKLVASAVEEHTGGYIDFTSKGIEAHESVFTKDGKTVRLIGMIRIGEGRFYRDLFASFPSDALVLVEGVSDEKGLLKGKFSYNHIAGALGLAEQSGIQAEWMAKKAGETAQKPAADAAVPQVSNVIRADIDISDFSAKTVDFLREVGELYSAPSIWAAWRRIQSMSDRYTDKDVSAIYVELIDKRNAKLISTFDKNAGGCATVVIPWGAEHMPGIEKALRARGYAFQSRHALNVVEYAALF
ncbi:MAG: hypothetical protein WAW54_17325 [Parvibaculum sedimenti]|uniref:hypothetical protein n=1 Tax=Parvibaculum sedimenti TaxID=2608632 RepID=UPI003BB6B1B1